MYLNVKKGWHIWEKLVQRSSHIDMVPEICIDKASQVKIPQGFHHAIYVT